MKKNETKKYFVWSQIIKYFKILPPEKPKTMICKSARCNGSELRFCSVNFLKKVFLKVLSGFSVLFSVLFWFRCAPANASRRALPADVNGCQRMSASTNGFPVSHNFPRFPYCELILVYAFHFPNKTERILFLFFLALSIYF